MILYIALGIACLVPGLFLLGIRTFDLYGTGKFGVNIVIIGWGVVAYFIAAKVNPYMVNSGIASYETVIRITGPILEEFLKALILIYLVQRADFNYVVDGALYGFGAGIGFAVVENYEYVVGHADAAMMVAIARVFSTNLVHATGSGVIGTALAYHRGDSGWRGWVIPFVGYAFSMGLHVAFNTMVNSGFTPLFVAIGYGLLGVGFIWYIIKRGMNVQKEWVGEKLGAQDRVTNSETKMVTNIDIIDEALAPIKKQFGEKKAKLVRELINKQAEIGIKRKLIDTTPSENKKIEIATLVDTLAKEMDQLRNQIGYYCMLQVRTVYLEQDFKVFELIGSRIAAASTGQKGGGLFDRATTRMKRPEDSSAPSQEEQQP